MSSFNAQPKAPARIPRAGAFGWALNESMKQLMSAITTKVALSNWLALTNSGEEMTIRVLRTDTIRRLGVSLLLVLSACGSVLKAADMPNQTAEANVAATILRAAGVQGGLIVHLGCGDGKLAAALGAGEDCLVQGLEADASKVGPARQHIRKIGLYGKVSVDRFDGKHLPYVDNLVNLLVAQDLGDVSMDEVMRVLCPRGVAYVKTDGAWTRTVKSWPDEIDEWTHYLHDASGNAVASDARVGVPKRAQWIAAPLWPRSHEYTPSISALVSSGGRIFYVMDDGIRGVFDDRFSERWAVYARDAFNGIILWKRPFSEWGPSQWKASGHWSTPMSLPRRLVSTGNRVYVTLGYRDAVSVLDATTGETVGKYDQTKNTDEIILREGILLARCRKEVPDYPKGATAWNVTVPSKAVPSNAAKDPARLAPASMGDETLVAVDTRTDQVLWEESEKRIVTLSLAALDGKVCYHTFEELVCLDLAKGEVLWRQKSEPWPDLTGTGITLVMYQDAVFVTGSQGLVARSADTGKELWRGPRIPRVAPRQPADLLIAGGLVWTSLTPEMPMGTVPKQRTDTPRVTGTAVQGLDPRTGEIRKTVDIAQLVSVGHHVRCYRSKGTQQYLLWPKRGVEFVDIAGGKDHMRCDWTRGECSYGVLPANGLLYLPPHPCVCFTGVALNGFNALAAEGGERRAESGGQRAKRRRLRADERLEQGPAFGNFGPPPSALGSPPSADWPMYRHDPSRSGCAGSIVPANVQPLWTAPIGGRLTQPVVAGGRAFVVSRDEHTIYCLDEKQGRRLWAFTAGGRIDSSPTLYNGSVLFGCRDGWVYCLRVSDGVLIWRFQAAPEERKMIAFGQVESAWGVHGSLPVVNGTLYAAAGRSSFLDGGIFLYGLDPATGKVLHQAHLDGPWPDIRKDQGQSFHMEGAKTDVLVSDGMHLYMFHNTFDLELKQVETTPRGGGGDRVTGLRLTATSSLLDDTLHDRFYWFHNRLWPGSHFAVQGPKSGHILVFDEEATYGQRAFSRRERLSPKFTPGREGYLLFADLADTEPLVRGKSNRATEYRPSKPPKWSANVPVRALAMVLTKEVLFFAGPPDVVPQEDPYAAMEGRRGARLWAVALEDGAKLAEQELDSLPVFDGMSAAGGRLYVSTQAGNVLCMEAGR